MTFNHLFHLEFCFNCYENDPAGRSSLSQAIKNIVYRDGQTYTAGAARCACRDLLNETCGLKQDEECIDIVFITDGHSNDPFLRICEEVKCLHDRGSNTYAITTGNYNIDEIQCIEEKNVEVNILLNGTDIDEIIQTFEDAVELLQKSDGMYSCYNRCGLLNNNK